MSRYVIPAIDLNHNVVVGWDNPLQTFFAIVSDETRDEDNKIVQWIGIGNKDIIVDINELQKQLEQFALIPRSIKMKLKEDYQNRTEPTPLQKMMKKLGQELF